MSEKRCFMDANRPCDLTCKASFEVDDPVDNVDCYFIWLAHHFGEGLFELRRVVEGFGGGGFTPPSFPGSGPGPGPTPPKGPKGFPDN
jgi:hypothetical protein